VSDELTFGKYIRKLREAKKKTDPRFSLRQFAQAVGISATFLSKVENDEFKPPKLEKIKKMAQLLEVDPDELLARAGKVDTELSDIIREQPKAMADFLRAARDKNLSEKQIKGLIENINKENTERSDE
jgi:transcriptional regulator with XRE-family HTH domain